MRKPWYIRKRKIKATRDRQGEYLRTWPLGCWRSPSRRWKIWGRRTDWGWHSSTYTATYLKVSIKVAGMMQSGVYEWVEFKDTGLDPKYIKQK